MLWVDNIFYAGTKEFERKVMGKIGEMFLIGRTEEETLFILDSQFTPPLTESHWVR